MGRRANKSRKQTAEYRALKSEARRSVNSQPLAATRKRSEGGSAINHQLSTINFRWWLAALLGLLTLCAYQPVWHAGFIWDDDAYVTDNPALRSAGGLQQIWANPTATPQYYPLVHTTFWLEYHLWGLNPLGYHLVNVFLHLVAAILLWRVLAGLAVPCAWLAAGIFALHPVNVESVAWVTERKNVLSTVCYLAAALAYWRWTGPWDKEKDRPRSSPGWYLAALGLFIAALLSKSVTASLPAAILLLLWWKRGRIGRRDIWPLLPFFAVGMMMGLHTSWLERTHVGASGPEWAFSFWDRCLIAGRAVWFYAGKLFWPANLTFIYPRWEIDAGEWWQWLFPVAALAVVVLLWGLRRRIGRGPLVAALFFGGTLFPALGFANVYPMRFTFVADHYQYVAGIGLITLFSAGLGQLAGYLGPGAPWLKPATCLGLALTLGVLTWKQAQIYADVETLLSDTVAKNPASWMAHHNLGSALLVKGQTDRAISEFQEALRLKPDFVEARINLDNALGTKVPIEEAISQSQEALRLNPNDARAHYDLAVGLIRNGQIDEAISQLQAAIRLKPDDARAHYNLGVAFANKGQFDTAISELQEAVRLNPDYAEARMTLARALQAKALSPPASPNGGTPAPRVVEP